MVQPVEWDSPVELGGMGSGKNEGPARGAFEIWGCEEGFLKPSRMYEALTMPSAVPALGHDVSTDCRTHSVDLSAQKLSLFAPHHGVSS